MLIIGVHAIFGAFLIGIICPHGIFAIKLQEKIEDLVSVLLLPLYFALSGLNTNLGLLDSGVVWGYVIGVCAIALIGKIVGGTVAARLNGLVWRESLAIGCLMSCKGLVELIVLNIGFQARILSQRTFTIFVVMALITTFTTTPLVLWIYPPWYRTKLQLWRDGKLDWSGDSTNQSEEPVRQRNPTTTPGGDIAQKVLFYLRLDSLSSIFTLTSLLARKDHASSSPEIVAFPLLTKERSHTGTADQEHMSKDKTAFSRHRPLEICGLRLMELSERDSSVMKVCESGEFAARDPVIKAFTTFGHSQDTGVAINGQLSVVPLHTFSDEIIAHAQNSGSEFIFLPWSETGTMDEYTQPLDSVIPAPSANTQFSDLAKDVFYKASRICNVGVLLNWNVSSPSHRPGIHNHTMIAPNPGEFGTQQSDRNSRPGSPSRGKYRIIVPFMGTKDGICAVRLGFQLAENHFVELEVLDLRSHGKVQLVDSNSTVNAEFEAIKANIHSSLADRVSFVEDSKSLLSLDNNVISRLHPRCPWEIIAIVGRDLTSHGSTGDLSAAEANLKNEPGVLGWLATKLLAHVIEDHSSTALLVVQATGEPDHDDPKARRKSASAHFGEAITEAGHRLSWVR
ncbi:hypothetical protein LTR84_008138 [Exophiala bonariae]|uniref:Cation/H+ exchanger transmembrane domain-containing protein n=1 Tax=Exophiala bonariae TaxID=1690606 RepID=A0AAV9NQL6_9EURO|nr:hypothetical protein LTR84_008138 [Exophiala bonariae]